MLRRKQRMEKIRASRDNKVREANKDTISILTPSQRVGK